MAGALLLTMIGCRKESDRVLCYSYIDNMVFSEAENSFVKKFDILWHGLNSNYALWDFEKEYGLDWDEVYDRFRPRFTQLDEKGQNVTDEQLQQLLEEMLTPLHDGHLDIDFVNHITGNTVYVSPGKSRLKRERSEESADAATFSPSLIYYRMNGQTIDYRESFNALLAALVKNRMYVEQQLESLTDPSLTEIYNNLLQDLNAAADATMQGNEEECLELYNKAVLRYEYLNIPDLVTIAPELNENAVNIKYACI